MRTARAPGYALAGAMAAALVAAMTIAPKTAHAMPTFAQATGLACSACHTQVPQLNAYGRYVARTGYSVLDRHVLAKALPIWIGEAVNYDSTAGSGTGVPRTSFGNLAIHSVGYAAPDVTYHAQQYLTSGDQSGGVDTLWVAYNKLFGRNGHLFVGKVLNPAPSPYSQDFEIDGAAASNTLVGEHDWAATYGNRWGTRLAYVRKELDLEIGYFLTSEDLNGINDYSPGDKTFQWKLAYARPDVPVEAGVFGSTGSLPVSSGTDAYRSVAAFVQVDPGQQRPGIFLVYHRGNDNNPGINAASGNLTPATASHGASFEIYEPILRHQAMLALRRDLNSDGLGAFSTGTAINLAFNIPGFSDAHGYLEANLGGNSALAGASGGPTWKGMLWLTLPVARVANANRVALASHSLATSDAGAAPAGADLGDAARGKTLYAVNCAACHNVSGAAGGVGPTLKGESTKMNFAALVARIKKPIAPMPKLYPSPLSAKDVSDVAAYVETL